LLKKRLSFSGHPEMEARTRLPLVLQTTQGAVPVLPMVINQSRKAQVITFDGVTPRSFIDRRCKELKWSRTITRQIEHICSTLGNEGTRGFFSGIVGSRTRKRPG